MKRLLIILVALIVVLALVVVLYPKIGSKETIAYNDAVKACPTGKFVTVDGKKVHYVEKGNGKPLILLHGYLYNTMTWNRNIDALAKQFTVYALDQWGFGYSERPNGMKYSFPVYGKQVIGFMDALKIDKASVGGHSMGGGTSVYVAAHYPDRVNRVVLVAPAVLPHEASALIKIYSLPFFGEFLSALPRGLILENLIKGSCFRNPEVATEEYFEELFKPLGIMGSSEAALYIRRNLFKPPGLKPEADRLAKTGIPILLVHGNADPLVPIEDSKALHRLWKDSQLTVFQGAKHNPHEEYPDKFNKVVVEFLSQST